MKRLLLTGCALLLAGGWNAHADEAKQKLPELPKQVQVPAWRVKSKQPANIHIIKPKAFFRQMQNAPIVPGAIYVKFREGVTTKQMQDAGSRAQMKKVLHTFRLLSGTYRVAVPIGKEREAINAYLDNPDVVYAEPDYLSFSTVIPNDAGWSENGMYGMRRIRMPDTWDVTTGDPNFRIGVIDSGLYYQHPDIAANVWTNSGEIAGNGIDDDGNGYVDDVRGWNALNSNNDISDSGSHGTHVAGTVGAVGNNSVGVVGVNWRCKIVMVRCSNDGQGLGRTVEALEYLLSNGVRVSNHSYGGSGFSQTHYNMLVVAQGVGHIAVCAAGNDGTNNDTAPKYPASYHLDNVIAVANHNSDTQLRDSSNYGAVSVDLAAPGGEVLSTVPVADGLFGEKSGTSMASPHVCGAIGLIWSRFPNIKWQDMRSRILTGVIHENSYEGIIASEGRLDVARSMAVFVRYGGIGIDGTKSSPYINIPTALPKVPTGGHLMIRSTTTNWTGRLDKPMYIGAYDGDVVIGRQ